MTHTKDEAIKLAQMLDALRQKYSDQLYDSKGATVANDFELDVATIKQALAAPIVQRPSFKEWTQDYVRDNIHKLKATPPAPDMSKLKPENQQQMREWIADGSFAQRAIDTMFELSQEITELKKAQPAPVQPVAWMFQHGETGRMNYLSNDGMNSPSTFVEMNPRYALVCPLYTTPPAAQPAVQEPVGNWVWSWLMDWCKRKGIAPATQDSLFAMVEDARNKFTTPPAAQRPWVGLTDEELKDIELGCHKTLFGKIEAMQKVEAKLKEKNT